MRVISEKTEYPNMLPNEIVKSGVALSGDALLEFMIASIEDVNDERNEELEDAKESIKMAMIIAIDDAVNVLMGVKDDL